MHSKGHCGVDVNNGSFDLIRLQMWNYWIWRGTGPVAHIIFDYYWISSNDNHVKSNNRVKFGANGDEIYSRYLSNQKAYTSGQYQIPQLLIQTLHFYCIIQ